jgi:hypothetical protein
MQDVLGRTVGRTNPDLDVETEALGGGGDGPGVLAIAG